MTRAINPMTKLALVPPKTQHLIMNISALSLAKFPPKISYSWGLSFPCYKSVCRNRFQLACLATNSTSNNVNDKRRLADFPSNIWKDIDTCFTSTSTASRNSEFVESSYGKQIEEVKEMLIAPPTDDDPAKKVGFINLLCRLGVSYHFKSEIDQQLNHIFDAHYSQLKEHHDYDLYTVALLFRVFRQHGYKMSLDALQKWDTSSLDQLPDYMKIIYSEILNLFDEIDKEVVQEGRSYCVAYTKDTLKEMVRGYLQETQWFEEEYEPTFDEYMDNAFVTVGSLSISSTAFIGMEMAGRASFEWLQTWPNVVKAAYKIGRLMGDITSHQVN
ncbi:hypothetical protein Q3G72_002520 [Acer saccharum]|nr:hypothetical protein Q3G72_002520 [Acer saccharum]